MSVIHVELGTTVKWLNPCLLYTSLLVLVITVVDVLPKAAVIVWVKLLLAVLIVMVPALPSAMEPQLIDDARGMVANVTEPETDPDFSDHADVVAFVVKDADTGNV